jgi:D-tyrosyl-tRNA(Tyr) deacylase
MRACVQRVTRARASVEGATCGQIGRGLVVLLGVATDDTPEKARLMVDKIVGLRLFDDEAGKMNLSVADVSGALLVVSQFTLMADCRRGRRPSFTAAAPPELAEALYDLFVAEAVLRGVSVATGKFRAHMEVELVNDGPVTLIVDN